MEEMLSPPRSDTEQDTMERDPEVQLQVDRGPDWLFIRLNSGARSAPASSRVADRVWDQLERHFIFRLVLEVDDLEQLDGEMVRQLLKLKHRVDDRGGTTRDSLGRELV